jgi:phosphoglycerate dehydrogenase-like enzyme
LQPTGPTIDATHGWPPGGRRLKVLLSMSRTVVDDVLPPPLRDRLATLADVHPVVADGGLLAPEVRGLLADTDVLLTSWGCGQVSAAVLAAAPRLRAVVHAAGTIRGIVGQDVLASGVSVTTAAAANAVPVAEYTIAAIVLARKRAFRLNGHYRRHERRNLSSFGDLGSHGITVGVVGASRIGRLVMAKLAAMDVTVLLSDPHATPEEAESMGASLVDLDSLFSSSDVVTLHAPELPETRHVANARRLSLMPDGGVLINTARGSLVDHDALLAETSSGRLDAVLDVTDPEPLPPSSPFYDLPNVLLTPHIAGALGTERARLGEAAVAEIERLAAGLDFLHLVQIDDLGRIA